MCNVHAETTSEGIFLRFQFNGGVIGEVYAKYGTRTRYRARRVLYGLDGNPLP